MSKNAIGRKLERFLTCRNRILKPPRILEGEAKVYIVPARTKWVKSYRLLEHPNGFFRPTCID